jgi:hypothetical protein
VVEQALARDEVAQHLADQRAAAAALVQRARALHQRGDADGVVVAEVAADAGQRVLHLTPMPRVLRVADAGELQQMRRVDGAAGQDDVAPRLDLACFGRPTL